eukprot:gene3706-4515_t
MNDFRRKFHTLHVMAERWQMKLNLCSDCNHRSGYDCVLAAIRRQIFQVKSLSGWKAKSPDVVGVILSFLEPVAYLQRTFQLTVDARQRYLGSSQVEQCG